MLGHEYTAPIDIGISPQAVAPLLADLAHLPKWLRGLGGARAAERGARSS